MVLVVDRGSAEPVYEQVARQVRGAIASGELAVGAALPPVRVLASDLGVNLLNNAKLELRAAEQSRDALKRELEGEEPVFLPETPAGTPGAPASELDARIEAQKKSLDELLRRYTDQHPDVVGTRRLIEQLEEERKQELAKRAKATTASGQRPSINANPVIQQLKIALAESEANVASLRARVSELDARYTQLRAAARMQPELEAELTQLNRDYDIQKKQYESVVTRIFPSRFLRASSPPDRELRP